MTSIGKLNVSYGLMPDFKYHISLAIEGNEPIFVELEGLKQISKEIKQKSLAHSELHGSKPVPLEMNMLPYPEGTTLLPTELSEHILNISMVEAVVEALVKQLGRFRECPEPVIATADKLMMELVIAGAPIQIIQNAQARLYDECKSGLATPLTTLVEHLTEVIDATDYEATKQRLRFIITKVKTGKFDCADWEWQMWRQSDEGKATIKSVTG
jgi:hypothetical protein